MARCQWCYHRHALLVLLIYDNSCPFASIRVKEIVAEIVYGSEPVQGSEGDGARAVRRGRSQDRKNDRKTTGFTKPRRPELNLGKEKVKVW
jgi:hypothetical protein